jgi:hypothetical protein
MAMAMASDVDSSWHLQLAARTHWFLRTCLSIWGGS